MTGLPDVAQRTVQAAFARAVAARPDDLAHIDAAGQWTFAESLARCLRLAAGIRSLGVGKQQPVAFLLDNSVDTVHVWLSLGLTGVIEVPVNTAYKRSFLTGILNDSRAEVVIAEDHYVARIAEVADELSFLRTVVIRGDVAAGRALPRRCIVVPFSELDTVGTADPVAVTAADLLAYMYTSGTTGQSKGVMCSHAHAYTYASREDDEDPRPRPGDRVMVTLPLFHLAGQWASVYESLIHQVPCIIEPGFSVSRFWPSVRAHGITITGLMGTMAELLWQQPAWPGDIDNPLELAWMAPVPSDINGFCQRFGIEAMVGYGMSEIGRVLAGPPGTVLGSEVGFQRPAYDLRLVSEQGEEVREGQAGELWVRPVEPLTVMSGYLNLPEKTAEMVQDGWVHTGDVLRKDGTGRYYFTDRVKDALRRRGENISSFEVERVINSYPAVLESAVVAVPSELTEDEIRAVVVARPGHAIDPSDLTDFLIDKLPYFMVPRYVEVVDELPKTPTQKIRKQQLRARGLGPDAWDREAAGIRLGKER